MKMEIKIINNKYRNKLYYKETPTQAFSCEYFEIFKNTFLYRTLLVAASVNGLIWEILLLWGRILEGHGVRAHAWIFMNKNRHFLINFGQFEDNTPLIPCRFKIIRVWNSKNIYKRTLTLINAMLWAITTCII